MEFRIESQAHDINGVRKKIDTVLLELGLRHDNGHVGSGRGGNETQLVILCSMKHIITDEHSNVFFREDKCYWNAASIAKATLRDVREYMDAAFDSRPDDTNINALPALIKNLLDGTQAAGFFETCESFIPEVRPILNGEKIDVTHLSTTSTLLVSICVCAILSRKIDSFKVDDRNYKPECSRIPEVKNVGQFLSSIPIEIALVSARRMIGLERLILGGIYDESKEFNDFLDSINNRLLKHDKPSPSNHRT